MTILGHKITNIQMTIQICTWGTYKYKIPLVMLGEQNLSSTFPNTLFTKIRSLRGLYGLEGQTKDEFSKPFDHIRGKNT